MTALAAALALLTLAPPPLASGQSFHYEHPGALARVAAIRHMPVAWDRITGLASTPDCGRLADPRRPWLVTARWADGTTETYQQVDCSDPRDRALQARRRLVLEVDLATARRHHFAAPTGPGHAPVAVLRYTRLP
jgi:hypothetical protein